MNEIIDIFSIPAIYITAYLIVDFLITGIVNRKNKNRKP